MLMFFAETLYLGLDVNTWQVIGVIIAFFAVVGTLIAFIVRSIFKIARFAERMKNVEGETKNIRNEIVSARTELTKRIDDLINISLQSGLSKANSPRVLTEEGMKVLRNSGIDQVVDDKFEYIVRKVDEKKPDNAYQAQQGTLDVVEELINDETLRDAIENGAFQSGYPIPAVLYVGGLYIRDRVLEELGFDTKEIDTHDPSEKKKKSK